MTVLINPSGIVVEVDDENEASRLVKKQGFKYADPTTERGYTLERNQVGLAEQGIGLFFRPNNSNPHGYGQSTLPLVNSLRDNGIVVSHDYHNQKIGLVYSYPHALELLKTEVKILYSMFESTSISKTWIQYLKMADKIFVPSKFCQEAFAARGIKTDVIPLGYNPEIFYYKEKDYHDTFTFLMYNAFDMRKGWDILFKAFNEEFENETDVKLILKTTLDNLPIPIMKSQYPKVEVITEKLNQEELRQLHWDSDCFVFPSRGEGFGLPPLEAIACGTPAIVTRGSGMRQYFDDRYMYGIDKYTECEAIYENFDKREVGTMIEPDKDELREKMRYVYEHRDEAYKKGKEGAKWVKQTFPISKTGKLLADEIKKFDPTTMNSAGNRIVVNPKSGQKKAAVFLHDRNFRSGGRIYTYQIANALSALGYQVTVYTDIEPIFKEDIQWGFYYDIKVVPFDELEYTLVDADVYVGSTREGINAVCNNVKGHKDRKGYALYMDSVDMIEKFDPIRTKEEREYHKKLDKRVNMCKNVDVIVLTEYARESAKPTFPNKKVFALAPCVNEAVANKFENKRLRKWMVMASTTNGERSKGFWDALRVFRFFSDDWQFHIFTSSERSKLPDFIKQLRLEDCVVPHYDEDDDKKFEVFSQAKILLSGSLYEGFGIWLAEARYMGLSCVVYDNPVFREIMGKDKFVHYAERQNELDLLNKLAEAMKDEGVDENKKYTFQKMVDKLRKILP